MYTVYLYPINILEIIMKIKFNYLLCMCLFFIFGNVANATSLTYCYQPSFKSHNFHQEILNITGASNAQKGHLCSKVNSAYHHAQRIRLYAPYTPYWYHELYYCTAWLKYHTFNYAANYSKSAHSWIKHPTDWRLSWANNIGMYNYAKFAHVNANAACLAP